MMQNIRERFDKTGIALFREVQILDLGKTGQEIFVEGEDIYPLLLGKNKNAALQHLKISDHQPVFNKKEGKYFYWYTRPTFNYYHTFLDSFGCLCRYLELKERIPDLQFMFNQSPTPKGGSLKHPPYVYELLELLGIDYQLTDENTQYELVYFGDTMCNDPGTGKRIWPSIEQYTQLNNLIQLAHKKVNLPPIERVYLSRRAHANPLKNRKDIIGEDNTVKRGLTNEDQVVDILSSLGYTEVFGENYTLAEKIVLFNGMKKYISTAGAGVTNIIWTMPNPCSVGGIHTPGFPFPSANHKRHICCHPDFIKAKIDNYPGKVRYVDESGNPADYNRPWYINNLVAFENWAKTI